MGKLSRSLALAMALIGADPNQHPRETQAKTAVINAAGGEVVIPADGCTAVSVYLSGTFNQTYEVAGTIDYVNWIPIIMAPYNQASLNNVAVIAGTTQGAWIGKCGEFAAVRVRCTSSTSGAASVFIIADNGLPDDSLSRMISPNIVTAVGVSGAAVTLTLPAPGAGLRQHVTYLALNRFAAAALVAAATPVTGTSSAFPGSLAFSFGAEALAQGILSPWREDFAFPIPATAQNTAMTIALPATLGVIWRATAGYYLGR
jgi:hypothetical protein